MRIGRPAAVTNPFKRVLAALNPAVIVHYDRKLMIGVLLAMAAFVPASGIAVISLSTISDAQNQLTLLHDREIHLSQQLKDTLEAEDTLMPLFVLNGDHATLDQLHQKEHDFDAVLTQLQDIGMQGSHAIQLLNNIELLARDRSALAGPGIAMRLHEQPIQNVNHYFQQTGGPATYDLHRSVDAFVQFTNTQYEAFVRGQRRNLRHTGIMLLTADAFALAVCMGVGGVILRLLQAKRQHDTVLVRQAEWERALATARKEAVETVAHDLRNPLHVMMLAAEKLQHVTVNSKSAHTALDSFSRSAVAMRRLIDTVLNPANIGANTLPVFKKPLDLHPMLHDVVGRFTMTAAAESINLIYAPFHDPPQLVADAARLEQVVSNLLANAIKFTPAGGSVTLATAWADPWVTITVADTGYGMSPEQVENVFDRYWRGDAAPAHGFGLGLAISKAIVDAHGGRIEVNSTLGQGTCFTVSMPVIPTTLQENAHQRAPAFGTT